jgi:hypothetical protein
LIFLQFIIIPLDASTTKERLQRLLQLTLLHFFVALLFAMQFNFL